MVGFEEAISSVDEIGLDLVEFCKWRLTIAPRGIRQFLVNDERPVVYIELCILAFADAADEDGPGRAGIGQAHQFGEGFVVSEDFHAQTGDQVIPVVNRSHGVLEQGCVFAELMGRQPLFPGKNHLNQVQMIQQFVGKIPEDDLNSFEDKVARDYLVKNEQSLGLVEQLEPA